MDEITAEYSTEQLAPSRDLRVRLKTTIACKTDLGRVRENNEDKFEFFVSEDDGVLSRRGHVYLVCDGMGGHAAGQIASELSAKTFIDVYLNHPGECPETAAIQAVVAANRFVTDVGRVVPSRRGMGTTLSGLILIEDQAMVVQVGDSRVYRLRGTSLEQLTQDHTWIEESVRSGAFTYAEAENHPYKHVITRAIGSEGEVKPDVFWHELQQGDTFLLCSDGLTNHLQDPELLEILAAHDPATATWKLVGQALLGGGSDNCTVLVVRVDSLEPIEPLQA
jgi:protein phosphatase